MVLPGMSSPVFGLICESFGSGDALELLFCTATAATQVAMPPSNLALDLDLTEVRLKELQI